MDSCIYKDFIQENQEGFVRQTNDNCSIKSNCNSDIDKARATEIKEKELFILKYMEAFDVNKRF